VAVVAVMVAVVVVVVVAVGVAVGVVVAVAVGVSYDKSPGRHRRALWWRSVRSGLPLRSVG
jgi:hypothetical protein